MRVALISCASTKRNGCHKAKDLYISRLFTFAWQYCNHHFDMVFILSAKHGLLAPERRIKNYNANLNDLSVVDRRYWSKMVAKQILQKISRDDEIYFFCGRKYREFVIKLLKDQQYHTPLEGLGIGQQLHWYKMRL